MDFFAFLAFVQIIAGIIAVGLLAYAIAAITEGK